MKKVTIARKPSNKRNDPLAADAWIGMANKSEPGERTKRLTIDVSTSLHQRIKCNCAMQGLKMADVIRDLLENRFPVEPKSE